MHSGLRIAFQPASLEKYSLTGTLTFTNTSPDTLRLHPDIGEFITLDLRAKKGTAIVKKFTYDFWGLDFGSRIMVPCDSPMVIAPGGVHKYSLDFGGRHFGVWTGDHGYVVQGGRFKFTRYSSFKVRYDSRYRFENLPDRKGPIPNGGCYFCYNGNWGYSSFYKSKYDCEQLAKEFEPICAAPEKCGIPFSKLVVESDWKPTKR